MKEWISKIQWDKVKSQQGLHIQCDDLKRQVADVIGSKLDEVVKELITFIDTNAQNKTMQPWKRDKEYALKHLAESLRYKAMTDIEQLSRKEVVNILKNTEQDKHKKDIVQKARQLAEHLLSNQDSKDTEILHDAFNFTSGTLRMQRARRYHCIELNYRSIFNNSYLL